MEKNREKYATLLVHVIQGLLTQTRSEFDDTMASLSHGEATPPVIMGTYLGFGIGQAVFEMGSKLEPLGKFEVPAIAFGGIYSDYTVDLASRKPASRGIYHKYNRSVPFEPILLPDKKGSGISRMFKPNPACKGFWEDLGHALLGNSSTCPPIVGRAQAVVDKFLRGLAETTPAATS